MNFKSQVDLTDGSTMSGSALVTAVDIHTKAQADVRFAFQTDLDTKHYTRTQMQIAGQSSLHWSNVTNKPTYDNYGSWKLKANGEAGGQVISSGSALDVKGSGATTVSRTNGVITVSSANDNNYLSSVSGAGNGTLTLARNGLSSLTVDLAHTHSVAQVTGLQAELNTKETKVDAAAEMTAHATSDAPHTYGGKFQFAYNPAFGTLDLQVIV